MLSGTVDAGIGTNRSYSGEGLGAPGRPMPEVNPDLIADPEGPAGVEGGPINGKIGRAAGRGRG